jgi:iron complex outermembrane recepter protein
LKKIGPITVAPTAAALLWVLVVGVRLLAEPQAGGSTEQTPAPETFVDKGAVQEVGGRLVTTGETVVVKGDADRPVHDSSVATKIDTPLIETPRSVTIVEGRTLDEWKAINITQAHDYTVGFTPLDERGPAFARGFQVDFYDLRRDGLRTYSWSVREPVALDRIQYLRGSAAVFYGDGSPGGLINMVLKKPLPAQQFEVSGSGGGLDFGRVTADATGPLKADRTIRYRLIGAAEWLGNGFDNRERRLTFFPTVAFDLGSKGIVTVDTEIYAQRGRNYRHVVPATPAAQHGDFSQMPWNLSIAAPDDGWTGSNVAPGVRLDLALGQRSSLHVAGRYTRIDGDLDLQALSGLAPDGRTALRYHYREISTWDEYQSDAFAATTGHTGSIEHRFVAGVEAGLSTADSQIGIGPASSLDIYQPVYGPPPPPVPALLPTRYDVTRVGLYAVDQMRLGAMITVVPGVRWSRLQVEDKVAASTPANAAEANSSEALVSPNIGVVILPRPWFSVYSTYTQGFEPPAPGQYLEDGRAPALSENGVVEAGLKADLAGQRLSLTAAGFHIRRTNVPETDPKGFIRQIGEAASRGLEFEAIGTLRPGWSVRSGYAWTETEITRDTSGFVGRELPNAPRHKADLWTRYQFPSGTIRNLMIGAGVVHVSDRFTARDNVVVAPSYTRFDASASCDLAGPRLTLGLVAQNLTDLHYVTSGNGGLLFAGPARRVAVQVTSRF